MVLADPFFLEKPYLQDAGNWNKHDPFGNRRDQMQPNHPGGDEPALRFHLFRIMTTAATLGQHAQEKRFRRRGGGSRNVELDAMSSHRRRRSGGARLERGLAGSVDDSSWVHGSFLSLVCLSVFFVTGPWSGFHGLLLGLAGFLVLIRPQATPLPHSWWLLATGFIGLGFAAFLPVSWFGEPDWRRGLAELGVETGSLVVIQARQAAEMLALFALMVLTGLWLAGHRASGETLRRCALAFTIAVAVYAVVSRLAQVLPMLGGGGPDDQTFGFFPNRNHSATYLAMGAVCGIGSTLQFGRDKRFVMLGFALASTAVILWAIAAWSVSRAGVVLTASGLLGWISLLGRRYLGRHGLWGIALILLAAIGCFLLTHSEVKERLSDTVEKAGAVVAPAAIPQPDAVKSALDSPQHLDFRIPVYLDTVDMIARYPLTGIGAGQFHYVFPQYRNRTAVAQDADAYHPESDWLWLGAELGLPAALALLSLVVLATITALRGLRAGRDRALRSACLVAALLVPFHGCFDVPGHRISLAWGAALLFSLSLHPAGGRTLICRWPSRLIGLVLLLAAAFLIHSEWLGGHPPATTAAQAAVRQAQALYQQDLELQKAADAKGLAYQPAPEEDKLERALGILDAAKAAAPLDRNLLRHEAFVAIHFVETFGRIDQVFAIDRALDPKWVFGPLRQAETWAPVDPLRSIPLIEEALVRSRILQSLDPENLSNHSRVRLRIRQIGAQYPTIGDQFKGIDSAGYGEAEKSGN